MVKPTFIKSFRLSSANLNVSKSAKGNKFIQVSQKQRDGTYANIVLFKNDIVLLEAVIVEIKGML